MKLGVQLGYWMGPTPPPQQLEIVLEAERLGYDSAWFAEVRIRLLLAAVLDRIAHEPDQARHRRDADLRAHADVHRDDRGDDRSPVATRCRCPAAPGSASRSS